MLVHLAAPPVAAKPLALQVLSPILVPHPATNVKAVITALIILMLFKDLAHKDNILLLALPHVLCVQLEVTATIQL